MIKNDLSLDDLELALGKLNTVNKEYKPCESNENEFMYFWEEEEEKQVLVEEEQEAEEEYAKQESDEHEFSEENSMALAAYLREQIERQWKNEEMLSMYNNLPVNDENSDEEEYEDYVENEEVNYTEGNGQSADYEGYEQSDEQSYESDEQSYESDEQSYELDEQSYESDEQSYESDEQSYESDEQSYESDEYDEVIEDSYDDEDDEYTEYEEDDIDEYDIVVENDDYSSNEKNENFVIYSSDEKIEDTLDGSEGSIGSEQKTGDMKYGKDAEMERVENENAELIEEEDASEDVDYNTDYDTYENDDNEEYDNDEYGDYTEDDGYDDYESSETDNYSDYIEENNDYYDESEEENDSITSEVHEDASEKDIKTVREISGYEEQLARRNAEYEYKMRMLEEKERALKEKQEYIRKLEEKSRHADEQRLETERKMREAQIREEMLKKGESQQSLKEVVNNNTGVVKTGNKDYKSLFNKNEDDDDDSAFNRRIAKATGNVRNLSNNEQPKAVYGGIDIGSIHSIEDDNLRHATYAGLSYPVMKIAMLNFLKEHGVEQGLVDVEVMNKEFGKDNVNLAAYKCDIFISNKGITIGRS